MVKLNKNVIETIRNVQKCIINSVLYNFIITNYYKLYQITSMIDRDVNASLRAPKNMRESPLKMTKNNVQKMCFHRPCQKGQLKMLIRFDF